MKNCRGLTDAALDAARKVGIVLGTMPTERAVLATRTEAAGTALCAGCRARVDRGVPEERLGCYIGKHEERSVGDEVRGEVGRG